MVIPSIGRSRLYRRREGADAIDGFYSLGSIDPRGHSGEEHGLLQPGSSAKGALPDRQDSPTGVSERGDDPIIVPSVAAYFFIPELGVRGGAFEPVAVVSVPETTMDEDDRALLPEHQVRPARQVGRMKPIPLAESMKPATENEFGLCVAALDCGHVAMALLGGQRVGICGLRAV